VAVVQTRSLTALAVLQLVALTTSVVLVGVTEYQLLAATLHGRQDSLSAIRQKMCVMRSRYQTQFSDSRNFFDTCGSVHRKEEDIGTVSTVSACRIGGTEEGDVASSSIWSI